MCGAKSEPGLTIGAKASSSLKPRMFSAIMLALFGAGAAVTALGAQRQAGVTTAALAAGVTTDITRRRAINGRTLGEWLEASQADELGRVAAALRIAAAAGANRAQLVREARRALGVTDRNLAAIVESLATHAASNAREEAFTGAGANSAPRLTHWRWVAILDGRTSDVCRARSGKLYAVQSPHPTPPAHPRCRSSLAPVFEGQGPVREETYAQWLTRQPDDVQDEILGPERGRLFRSGRFTLTDFIEEPSGRRRRLDELPA